MYYVTAGNSSIGLVHQHGSVRAGEEPPASGSLFYMDLYVASPAPPTCWVFYITHTPDTQDRTVVRKPLLPSVLMQQADNTGVCVCGGSSLFYLMVVICCLIPFPTWLFSPFVPLRDVKSASSKPFSWCGVQLSTWRTLRALWELISIQTHRWRRGDGWMPISIQPSLRDYNNSDWICIKIRW